MRSHCLDESKSINSIALFATAALLFSGTAFATTAAQPAKNSLVQATHGIYPQYPKVNYGTGAKAKQIKHGEYLVKMGDCIACHTDIKGGGKQFAGNYPIDTPFGTIYTPNISSDKRTGIGAWTDKQFMKAVRDGVRPNGQYLYPALPFLWYTHVTDQDLRDIKAYLDVTPPIYTPTRRKNTIPFPLDIRFMQLGWRILFFHNKKQFQPDPSKSTQWNRGAYIVQGLGHCGMCHTPMNSLGAPKRKYALTGSSVTGFYAPNITSTNLKNTPIEEIYNVFMKDKLIGGGNVTAGMLEVNHDSLSYLNKDDLDAIATYLKTVVSQIPPTPKVAKGSGPGGVVYAEHCFACHKMGSGGAPKYGDAADWDPLVKLGLNTLYARAINGYKAMPAMGTCMTCSKTQIQDAVNYMVDAVKGKKAIAKPKPITEAQAKALYTKHCAACHDGSDPKAPKVGDAQAWERLGRSDFPTLFYSIVSPKSGHPMHGNCLACSGKQMVAIIKYMLHSSTKKNYKLW